MRHNPRPQEMYRHFKGNLYQIRCLARHSETGEMMVVYQAMYDTFEIYVRPLAMFMEEVDRVKYPDAVQKYRFELLQDMDGEDGEYREQTADGEPLTVQGQQKVHVEEAKTQQQAGAESAVRNQQANDAESAVRKQPSGEDAAVSGQQAAGAPSQASESDVFSADMESEELNIDPLVMEFLEADTYEQRLAILAALHCRVTDEMINTMAVAVDLEIKDGDVEERYEELKNCLLTFEKYECNRLR